MRIIQVARGASNTIEVNWMWLPTFIGQNSALIKLLVEELERGFPPPFEATEEVLDSMDLVAREWLAAKIGIDGLYDYLSAIKGISDEVF